MNDDVPEVLLDPIEWEVFCAFLKDGADTATVARRVGRTPDSTKYYLRKVFAKTGCPSGKALAVAVLRRQVRVRPRP